MQNAEGEDVGNDEEGEGSEQGRYGCLVDDEGGGRSIYGRHLVKDRYNEIDGLID